MATSNATISYRYRLFCWVACASLVLLGFAWIAFSYRMTTLTCRRSDLTCTISHLGWLPDPGKTFNVKDVQRVGLGSNGPNSGDPVFYHLFFQTKQENIPITYAWEKDSAALERVRGQINHFLNDPGVPELSIQMPDLRSLDRLNGIYLVTIGLIFSLINWNTLAARSTRLTEPQPGEASPFAHPDLLSRKNREGSIFAKKRPEYFHFWLWWLLVPVSVLVINFGYSVIVCMGICAPISLLIPFPLMTLACFSAQAMALNRLKFSGKSWLIRSIFSLLILFGLIVVIAIINMNSDYGNPATDQGSDTGFGLIVGSIIGLLQWTVLRTRLAHASWWILGSALAGMCVLVIEEWVRVLVPGIGFISKEFLNNFLDTYFIWIAFLIYSGGTGVVLIWMLNDYAFNKPGEQLKIKVD